VLFDAVLTFNIGSCYCELNTYSDTPANATETKSSQSNWEERVATPTSENAHALSLCVC